MNWRQGLRFKLFQPAQHIPIIAFNGAYQVFGDFEALVLDEFYLLKASYRFSSPFGLKPG
jgi:hypothetical protein